MIFQKRLKAGILLYALLMLSVFTLILQFYLQSHMAQAHNSRALKESSQAYIMALWTVQDLPIPSMKEIDTELVDPVTSTKKSSASDAPTKEQENPAAKRPAISGSQTFTDGRVSYQEKGEQLLVKVALNSGKNYQYSFAISSENLA